MRKVETRLRPEAWVLRLGHRPFRDRRVTTHLALTARALGAKGMLIEGEQDRNVEESVNNITANWGGDFQVKFISSPEKTIQGWKETGFVVHLTMYGLPFEKYLGPVRQREDKLLVVVGGKKVPGIIYSLANLNLAVTGQPHSEISALALFLDRLFEGKEMAIYHREPKMVVVPSPSGKLVVMKPKRPGKETIKRSEG
ncbi:MAG TPA: tRNA (cytidine(56)-2'-O)-methyltransferase [Thermoproteota archaeon]|nr:tRNA (cytidine(56)-2'-O)-methyltransferase [Thermoproteota archaeon]